MTLYRSSRSNTVECANGFIFLCIRSLSLSLSLTHSLSQTEFPALKSWHTLPTISMTKWLYYFLNIWLFKTMKMCPKYKIFAKVGSQFCQILNSYSRNCQKLFKILSKCRNFAKSGHTAYYLSLTTHLSTQSQRHSYLHSQCVPLLSTVMQYYLLTL